MGLIEEKNLYTMNFYIWKSVQATIHKGRKALRDFFQVKIGRNSSEEHGGTYNMLFETREKIAGAIDDAYKLMASQHYKDYILFIGRGDTIPGLKKQVGTDCVVDYSLDTYYDKTRSDFYLHYLNRNYRKDGFSYQGEGGIDDLHIELMIYCHLWDSSYFVKSMCRMASIVSGNGYLWSVDIPWMHRETFMQNKIIDPLKKSGLEIGNIVELCYDASVRNAFAHSLYTIDAEQRKISFRPQKGFKTLSFDEFQKLFLNSVLLMNLMENALELNHIEAAKLNGPLTDAFLTPDGVKVQIIGQMSKRGTSTFPEFRIVKIKNA